MQLHLQFDTLANQSASEKQSLDLKKDSPDIAISTARDIADHRLGWSLLRLRRNYKSAVQLASDDDLDKESGPERIEGPRILCTHIDRASD